MTTPIPVGCPQCRPDRVPEGPLCSRCLTAWVDQTLRGLPALAPDDHAEFFQALSGWMAAREPAPLPSPPATVPSAALTSVGG